MRAGEKVSEPSLRLQEEFPIPLAFLTCVRADDPIGTMCGPRRAFAGRQWLA
jgi:hypothetical protein